jgi:hypothetical protein
MTDNTKHPTIEPGNTLYIVCTVCGPMALDALLLASRLEAGFENFPDKRKLERFFEIHAKCGGTRDHFRLGMARGADLDLNPVIDPATNVKGAVKLALVKA